MSKTQNTQHTRSDWPTQLRLPGQAAAPEGPVDMMMMYVMHHAFRRDLTKFAAAARHTPAQDRETWRRLSARWATFSEVLHKHHSGEDAGLWPWLLEHGTPEDRSTLEAMEAEHSEIDPLLASCAEGFTRLETHADEDARAALAVRLAATRDQLGRHLEHEESDAIAILQRVMTPEGWEQLEKEHFQKDQTPRLVFMVVPWAAYDVPREDRDRVFEETGLGFKLVWLLTRRRFARREALAFKYVA